MNRLPNPEDILKSTWRIGMDCPDGEYDYIEAMKEYGRQVRDKTLEWAAENAKTVDLDKGFPRIKIIDKDSILNGKTSKDLEI